MSIEEIKQIIAESLSASLIIKAEEIGRCTI